MLRVFQGAVTLLLLSIFFAYLIAPAVAAIRRRVRLGPRQRPVSQAMAILILYVAIGVAGLVLWRVFSAAVTHWATVTAPATVDHLFGGANVAQIERSIRHTPVPAAMREGMFRASVAIAGSLEHESRRTLAEVIAASRYAWWLLVAPLLAFPLLTGAPAFQRSALRVLPRGHLRWRAEEYLRDVNSALAGYVRAQMAAALIVGVVAVCGFLVLGIPSAVSLGVTTGILELVPGIGPLTALLVTTSQATGRVVAVVVFWAILRVMQDYVVYPRLINHGMHLSTPAVILTIWCGAVLARAPGVLLAIPVAGFLSVSLRHWREYRDIEQLVRHPPMHQENQEANTISHQDHQAHQEH
jgi:predicted PurR-regulated permease PerM